MLILCLLLSSACNTPCFMVGGHAILVWYEGGVGKMPKHFGPALPGSEDGPELA